MSESKTEVRAWLVFLLLISPMLFADNPLNRLEHQIVKKSKDLHLGSKIVQQTQILIDDIPLEGDKNALTNFYRQDARYQIRRNLSLIEKIKGHFRLSPEESLASIHNKSAFFAPKKVWLARFNSIHPSYRFRKSGPRLQDLEDVWIDAETGRILKKQPAIKFFEVKTKVFTTNYSPAPNKATPEYLEDVTLKKVIQLEDSLYGHYFNVSNCCFLVECPDGNQDCPAEKRSCSSKQNPHAFLNSQKFELSTHDLGFSEIVSLETIHVDAITCLYRSGLKLQNIEEQAILNETPIDNEELDSDVDNFAAIQALYTQNAFFDYIRSVLNDDNYCLRPQAQQCTENGDASLDPRGLPLRALETRVNAHLPYLGFDDESKEGFFAQLRNGYGATKQKPLVFKDIVRIDNAAFIPASQNIETKTGYIEDILGDLIVPHDMLIFFQGERDNAYDGTVVVHETMHALTQTLAPGLSYATADQQGLNMSPGTLNEAWSDYMAASFTESSQIGRYVASTESKETAIRDISQHATCPQDLVGEVHIDSIIYSGAMWKIRNHIKNALGMEGIQQLDKLWLSVIAKSDDTETAEHFAENTLQAFEESPELAPYQKDVQNILHEHGIDECKRIVNIDKGKDMLFLEAPSSFGIGNYLPAPVQFKVTIPPGATKVTLSYSLYQSSETFTGSDLIDSSQEVEPLRFISSPSPISWDYEEDRAVPYLENDALRFDENDPKNTAVFENDLWRFEHEIPTSCEEKTLYLSALSLDNAYVMKGIELQTEKSSLDASKCPFKAGATSSLSTESVFGGCRHSTQKSPPESWLFIATYLLWASLRRYKRKLY